ncbi:probable DNA-directed RNA polymerase III subunit RPC6 [Phlebotomus papatasi]|uniref:probable DNA-directed RNA polymerase III subunit RPC6 n=1 Tax=Phlebotomus papatasi TaxID=29031 RepID=UPI002483524A|nr:probable DNA-directed RNA polymerase III subunit RPC6 [Phlebotomus papatasi]
MASNSAGNSTTSEAEVNAALQKVIELAHEKSGTLSNTDLVESFPEMTPAVRVDVINRMLQQGQMEVLKKGNQLVYRLKDPKKQAAAPKGADNEEKIVYSIIEEGGNKGIWIRDIRVKSNLIMTQLNKILKSLENKKLIKAVKSVNASKKKVYMLYNLDPDRSVTGGAWYQDQDFESEFVDVLNQQCLRYLQMRSESAAQDKEGPLLAKQKSLCSVGDVHQFISDLGISKVNLDEEDLETILKTVVYDGKAERIVQMDGSSLYRAIVPALPPPGLVQMPCGICPVISNCSTCGLVTPKTCQYMSEWLN